MLVDLPDGWENHRNEISRILSGEDYAPKRLAQGVYETHFNFSNDIRAFIAPKGDYPFSFNTMHDRHEMTEAEFDKAFAEWDWAAAPHDYGVCDWWEQIVERWPIILTSPRRFIISMAPVRHEDQSETGGWRWHKWGEYIGIHEPEHEYLWDEDWDIDIVYCFHVLEIL